MHVPGPACARAWVVVVFLAIWWLKLDGGVEGDAVLSTHQAGFALAGASLHPASDHFQLRMEHQCDRWLERGFCNRAAVMSETFLPFGY